MVRLLYGLFGGNANRFLLIFVMLLWHLHAVGIRAADLRYIFMQLDGPVCRVQAESTHFHRAIVT